jgi:hypothetical protein
VEQPFVAAGRPDVDALIDGGRNKAAMTRSEARWKNRWHVSPERADGLREVEDNLAGLRAGGPDAQIDDAVVSARRSADLAQLYAAAVRAISICSTRSATWRSSAMPCSCAAIALSPRWR